MKHIHSGIDLGTPTAWGCRAIFGGGIVDIVREHRSWRGDVKKLVDLMREGGEGVCPFDIACEVAKRECDPKVEKRVTLYEDDKIVIVGDTNGSYGYLYMGAGLKEGGEAG